MGNSWQSEDQKEFFDEYLTSYCSSRDEGKLRDEFWPMVIEEWFKRWPLSEPPAELVEKKGTVEKAKKVWKEKRIDQIKRVFKARGADVIVASRRNLHLEDSAPRKKSEVQMYMILYYDSRIRQTVVESWAEDGVPCLESRVEVNIPESEIEPHDSFTLKDPKIPISYKHAIARKLYDAESAAIKAEVRLQRETWHENGRTVRTTDEDERLSLVRDYQKNFPALSRNIGNILRNAEHKCAAKGIAWLACPAPSKGGKPVAFFQCAGTTPQGQDFESFIGSEKAKEFKALFSSWIHVLYPPSEWQLYSLGKQASDDLSTGSAAEQNGGENIGADTEAEHEDQATVASTVTDTTPLQPVVTLPAALAEADTVGNSLPSSDLLPNDAPDITLPVARAETNTAGNDLPCLGVSPNNPRPASPTAEPVDAIMVDQSHELSSRPDDILLAGIDDLPTSASEAGWMKLKQTLKYFREVHKIGRLSALILHWYQLEKVLGFLETVNSFAACATRRSPDSEQTPRGFPTKNRPQVLAVFFKNGHSYRKNYKLEAKSLGGQIMRWWEEMKISNATDNVRYGGPTGVYTLIVLVSWWSSLLAGQPENELTDCLRTVEDIDRAILSAIRAPNDQPPATPSPAGSSPTTSPALTPPAPRPRGRKRSIPEVPSSRKRLRVATA
ncbi:hypothetical protein BJ322DRAFT_1110992 [Thelephora terrestris]|uniref:Uncharacterized protein n=1 Tax=Thelephora terrestris TaxID=56493 RepID=A0A9P6H8X6_9AGAM|nr:hypothetical protein BJ322DRAFT_1110992 [Thelephora terrestris]